MGNYNQMQDTLAMQGTTDATLGSDLVPSAMSRTDLSPLFYSCKEAYAQYFTTTINQNPTYKFQLLQQQITAQPYRMNSHTIMVGHPISVPSLGTKIGHIAM